MKKIITLLVCFSFLFCGVGFTPTAHAQTAEIASVEAANDIALAAGGKYVSVQELAKAGLTAPTLSSGEVALPVIQEATGDIIGYIVAEQGGLVSALNAAGLGEIAAAVAAVEAGTVAGLTVGAGVATGTVVLGAVAAAGLIGLVVAIADDGGTTTTHHPSR